VRAARFDLEVRAKMRVGGGVVAEIVTQEPAEREVGTRVSRVFRDDALELATRCFRLAEPGVERREHEANALVARSNAQVLLGVLDRGAVAPVAHAHFEQEWHDSLFSCSRRSRRLEVLLGAGEIADARERVRPRDQAFGLAFAFDHVGAPLELGRSRRNTSN
jgi:hypothetical protein